MKKIIKPLIALVFILLSFPLHAQRVYFDFEIKFGPGLREMLCKKEIESIKKDLILHDILGEFENHGIEQEFNKEYSEYVISGIVHLKHRDPRRLKSHYCITIQLKGLAVSSTMYIGILPPLRFELLSTYNVGAKLSEDFEVALNSSLKKLYRLMADKRVFDFYKHTIFLNSHQLKKKIDIVKEKLKRQNTEELKKILNEIKIDRKLMLAILKKSRNQSQQLSKLKNTIKEDIGRVQDALRNINFRNKKSLEDSIVNSNDYRLIASVLIEVHNTGNIKLEKYLLDGNCLEGVIKPISSCRNSVRKKIENKFRLIQSTNDFRKLCQNGEYLFNFKINGGFLFEEKNKLVLNIPCDSFEDILIIDKNGILGKGSLLKSLKGNFPKILIRVKRR